jgi:hypothetical protein
MQLADTADAFSLSEGRGNLTLHKVTTSLSMKSVFDIVRSPVQQKDCSPWKVCTSLSRRQ